MICAGQLHLHGKLRQAEVESGCPGDRVLVLAAIDHLHVVDADDGQEVVECVQRRPGFEVTDNQLRTETVFDGTSVDVNISFNAFGGVSKILEQAIAAVQAILEVAQGQSVNLLHGDVGVTA